MRCDDSHLRVSEFSNSPLPWRYGSSGSDRATMARGWREAVWPAQTRPSGGDTASRHLELWSTGLRGERQNKTHAQRGDVDSVAATELVRLTQCAKKPRPLDPGRSSNCSPMPPSSRLPTALEGARCVSAALAPYWRQRTPPPICEVRHSANESSCG